MVQKISSHKGLIEAARSLAARDRHMARALARIDADLGGLPDRSRRPGFSALLFLIVGQQVSTASARAIWQRIEEAVSPLTPDIWLGLPQHVIDTLGLSKPKKLYARALAEALVSGTLDLERVGQMDLEAAEAHLTEVKGIGPWTARTYLLFCHGAEDVWPTGDIALHSATHDLLGLDKRPSTGEMLEIAEAWSPRRGVAAHILWAWYKTL